MEVGSSWCVFLSLTKYFGEKLNVHLRHLVLIVASVAAVESLLSLRSREVALKKPKYHGCPFFGTEGVLLHRLSTIPNINNWC